MYNIFVDIHKVYGSLDKYQDLMILEGCSVGLCVRQLLAVYWDRAVVMARASGYYGYPFKCYRGVTQWGPISPRIFSAIFDAIIQHWSGLLEENYAGPEGFFHAVTEKAAFF